MARRRIPGRARTRNATEAGKPNKTEAAYIRHLNTLQAAGVIHQYWFQAVKLRVAYDQCWIVIDFMVQTPQGLIELHDVKGGPTEDDAIVKEKVIATLFPFRLVEVRLKAGQWIFKEISDHDAKHDA